MIIHIGPIGLDLSFPSSHNRIFSRKGEESCGLGKPLVWKVNSWLQKQQQELYPSPGQNRRDQSYHLELPLHLVELQITEGQFYCAKVKPDLLCWQEHRQGPGQMVGPAEAPGVMRMCCRVVRPPLSSSGRSCSLGLSSPASVRMGFTLRLQISS